MKIQEFKSSLVNAGPPAGIPLLLEAMWLDAKGRWENAHDLVNHLENKSACLVHAYLHRKEGDLWNAQYWYNRAGKDMPSCPLDQEWEEIVSGLL